MLCGQQVTHSFFQRISDANKKICSHRLRAISARRGGLQVAGCCAAPPCRIWPPHPIANDRCEQVTLGKHDAPPTRQTSVENFLVGGNWPSARALRNSALLGGLARVYMQQLSHHATFAAAPRRNAPGAPCDPRSSRPPVTFARDDVLDRMIASLGHFHIAPVSRARRRQHSRCVPGPCGHCWPLCGRPPAGLAPTPRFPGRFSMHAACTPWTLGDVRAQAALVPRVLVAPFFFSFSFSLLFSLICGALVVRCFGFSLFFFPFFLFCCFFCGRLLDTGFAWRRSAGLPRAHSPTALPALCQATAVVRWLHPAAPAACGGAAASEQSSRTQHENLVRCPASGRRLVGVAAWRRGGGGGCF